MKIFEKYIDNIADLYGHSSYCVELLKEVNAPWKCGHFCCETCYAKLKEYLLSEYEEPTTDWSKVAVDAPILVSNGNNIWHKCFFAEYENNQVYAWALGTTSWSASENDNKVPWRYAKLAKEK